MRRAFITGISGQDGSYLSEKLIAEGWEIHALVRGAGIQSGENEVDASVVTHVGDLREPESVAQLISETEPDTVFNLAGISSVAQSWEQPDLTSRVTGHAVAIMLDAAWHLQERTGRPVRFVQASSSEIFGAASEVPQTESTPVMPVSPYGAAKAYAHHLVGVYRGKDLFASSAILYNHESPRRPATFVTRKITASVAAIAAGDSDSFALGNLGARRDWGWAPDYVDALLAISRAERPSDYVVATGEAHLVSDFVRAAFAVVGIADWEAFVTSDERFNRPVDAPEMIGDASKLRSELGWTPRTSFAELVRLMVENDARLLGNARS